ncbi:MAG: hypothetical protein IT258_08570, partial [Saprospiraceae bacterium]|nr:hypothetical protein [Saprospiraceae bacterium]
MKNLTVAVLVLGCLLAASCLQAQEILQTIRGTVTDKETNIPLIGAEVLLLNSDPIVGDATDPDGHFKIEKIPVG